MDIPRIVLDEAEKQGFLRMAAFLGKDNDCDIYSLGVNNKENWLPCPPLVPVIVSVKDNKLKVLEDEEAFRLTVALCEAD